MVKIVLNSPTVLRKEAEKELKGKVVTVLQQINDDIATLDGSPTNADVMAVVRRVCVRQRAIVKFLAKDLE